MKRLKILLPSPEQVQDGLFEFVRISLIGAAAGMACGMFIAGCKLALKIVP